MTSAPCENWALYRATVFRFSARIGWTEFAIVTAANPLGKAAMREQNDAKDSRLQAELESRGIRPIRVYGCSPDLVHQEPSWAAPVSLEDAIALGAKFEQDAIFYVRYGEVFLESCSTLSRTSESLGQLKIVSNGGE